MAMEEPTVGNTCGCLDHQDLSMLPANQPVKVGHVIRSSFEVGDNRAAGCPCTTVSWRWSELLTSTRKLSKAGSWAFHEMDTLPQVTFETVRWLRRGSATKPSRKNMRACQCKTPS